MIYLYNIAFDIFYYSTEEFLKYFSLSSSQIFEGPNVVVPPVFYFFKSKSATIVFSFLRLHFSHLPVFSQFPLLFLS